MVPKPTYKELEQKIRELERKSAKRHETGSALRESEERFRQLAENIRDIFYITDPAKTQMLYISPAYKEVWGRTRESLYKRPLSFVEAVVPDDKNSVLASFEKQKKGEHVQVACRVLRPDGSMRWIWSRAYPVKDKYGKLKRIVGIAEDVTQRRQIEKALRDNEKELKEKTRNLQEVNTALNVLLKKRENDKLELEDKVLQNIRKLVLPYLDSLKETHLDARQASLINILESNLKEVISPFLSRIQNHFSSFTPKAIGHIFCRNGREHDFQAEL